MKTTTTFDEFLGRCTACGGNWTAMFLTGIEACWPLVYANMPEWDYSFEDVSFIVSALCADKDTTWAGVHVDKFRGFEFPEHTIEHTPSGFVFSETPAELRDIDLDEWHIRECHIDRATIEAFEGEMHRKNNIEACSSIVWDLCHEWHVSNGTGLYLDNYTIYHWLLDQPAFVKEAGEAPDREQLMAVCQKCFEEEVLDLPWSQIGSKI